MALPGQLTSRVLQVVDQNNNPISGLNLASFTVYAFARPYGAAIQAAYAAGSIIQPIATNQYDLSFVLPPSAGWFYYRIVPNNALYRILGPNIWAGEVENYDMGKVGALVTTPVSQLVTSAVLGSVVNMQSVAYRTRPLSITITDQNGNPINLSGTAYNNWSLSIRSKDRTTTKWDAANGVPYGVVITGSSLGVLTLNFPDFSQGPIWLPWAANSAANPHQVGDWVVPQLAQANGYAYRCTAITTGITSPTTQPTWPTTIGLTVVDAGVTWTCQWFAVWQPSTVYAVGAAVRPRTGAAGIVSQYWKCTVGGTTGLTGAEPAWPSSPAAGATLTDNGVTWTYQSDYYASLTNAIAASSGSITHQIEVCAQQLATDTEVPIVRSSLFQLLRQEVGT